MKRNEKRGLRAWWLGGRDDWRSSIGSGAGPSGLDTGRLETPFAFVYLAGVGCEGAFSITMPQLTSQVGSQQSLANQRR